jgi:hypothetical protein
MKVLLDECVPRKLKNSFPDHDCQTVPEARFSGKKNGALLSLAEDGGFEIFLTLDKGIEYEQNLADRRIAVIILRAKSNRLAELLPLVSQCIVLMKTIKPGQVIHVGS